MIPYIERLIDNGKSVKFCLFPQEVEDIYRAVHISHMKEDLLSVLKKMICNEEGKDDCSDELPEVSETTTEKSAKLREIYQNPDSVCEEFEKALGRNDSYYETYWLTAEAILEGKVSQ